MIFLNVWKISYRKKVYDLNCPITEIKYCFKDYKISLSLEKYKSTNGFYQRNKNHCFKIHAETLYDS